MTLYTQGASAPTIDRETAVKLNPLISTLWTDDTLATLAGLTRDLGYFISISQHEDAEIHFGDMYLILGMVSAALNYERANPKMFSKHFSVEENP